MTLSRTFSNSLLPSFRPSSPLRHGLPRRFRLNTRLCSADHRELAHKQQLLTSSPYSPGSPLFLPHGTSMLNALTSLLRAHYPSFGFQEVLTPNIYKRSLWEKSGHWDNYADDMFAVQGRGAMGTKAGEEVGENEEFGLKPMNCPGHCLLFGSERRSYRDLPIRYADFGSLHRNEISGALTGLTRVRRFHQDDGHIFCTPEQIGQEIQSTLDFIRLIYKDIFDLPSYRLVLSTRPDNFIGTVPEWDRAESQLTSVLDGTGQNWTLSPGDGAFYGPKIDVILTDSAGKEHQTATIQLDFQLPQRFSLVYDAPGVDDSVVRPTPVLIHRAVLGSLERFLALLLEHYAGTYPLWLSPRPVLIASVKQSPAVLDYIDKVERQISGIARAGEKQEMGKEVVRVARDTKAEKLGKKVWAAAAEGYAFVVVVGPKDVEKGTVTVRFENVRHKDKTLAVLREVAGGQGHLLEKEGAETPTVETTPGVMRDFVMKVMKQYL